MYCFLIFLKYFLTVLWVHLLLRVCPFWGVFTADFVSFLSCFLFYLQNGLFSKGGAMRFFKHFSLSNFLKYFLTVLWVHLLLRVCPFFWVFTADFMSFLSCFLFFLQNGLFSKGGVL